MKQKKGALDMDFEECLENEPVKVLNNVIAMQRKEEGLSPISNESSRKAYIDSLVCDREREVLELEAIYHAIYESIQLRKVEH